jgi:hypothetical protein
MLAVGCVPGVGVSVGSRLVFSAVAEEMDSSGIGNKPYVIDLNNTDRYPLMEPFNSTFFCATDYPAKNIN